MDEFIVTSKKAPRQQNSDIAEALCDRSICKVHLSNQNTARTKDGSKTTISQKISSELFQISSNPRRHPEASKYRLVLVYWAV